MHQNLGKLDRILRFLLAFWWMTPAAPQFEVAWINLLITIVAWIALIESFWGWCALHQLFHIDNKNQ